MRRERRKLLLAPLLIEEIEHAQFKIGSGLS